MVIMIYRLFLLLLPTPPELLFVATHVAATRTGAVVETVRPQIMQICANILSRVADPLCVT